MFLWFSKTCFPIRIVYIHKDTKLGTKKIFPSSSRWDLNFCNYKMACKHTDLLLIIFLSLTKDLAGQSEAVIFTRLFIQWPLPLTLKMSHTENFISCLCHKCCFCKFECYALQTPMTDATIKQLLESLTIPKFADFPLQKVYTRL